MCQLDEALQRLHLLQALRCQRRKIETRHGARVEQRPQLVAPDAEQDAQGRRREAQLMNLLREVLDFPSDVVLLEHVRDPVGEVERGDAAEEQENENQSHLREVAARSFTRRALQLHRNLFRDPVFSDSGRPPRDCAQEQSARRLRRLQRPFEPPEDTVARLARDVDVDRGIRTKQRYAPARELAASLAKRPDERVRHRIRVQERDAAPLALDLVNQERLLPIEPERRDVEGKHSLQHVQFADRCRVVPDLRLRAARLGDVRQLYGDELGHPFFDQLRRGLGDDRQRLPARIREERSNRELRRNVFLAVVLESDRSCRGRRIGRDDDFGCDDDERLRRRGRPVGRRGRVDSAAQHCDAQARTESVHVEASINGRDTPVVLPCQNSRSARIALLARNGKRDARMRALDST